jgi:TonB family protein
MRQLVTFIISVIITILLFILPFPDVLVFSKRESVTAKKAAVKNFTIMNYNILSESADNSYDKIKQIKKDNMEKSFEAETSNNIEENADTVKSHKGEIEQESSQNSGLPNVIDYTPDFTINKMPVYPAAAKRMRQEGRVKLKIMTDSKGNILEIEIVQSSGYRLLDKAALEAVHKWDFSSLISEDRIHIIRTDIVFRLKEQ